MEAQIKLLEKQIDLKKKEKELEALDPASPSTDGSRSHHAIGASEARRLRLTFGGRPTIEVFPAAPQATPVDESQPDR